MIAMNGSRLGRTAGPVRRYPGATACSSIFATVLHSIPNWRAAALLLIPSTGHARRTRLYQSTQYISRPQLVRLGPKMRTFTPRWSDYPTDPTDHFVSGIHTQGKIERWHHTLKNRIVLENYFLPSALEQQSEAFVEHYNHQRYHESLKNLTPADVYFGHGQSIRAKRERIKRKTIAKRRLHYQRRAA